MGLSHFSKMFDLKVKKELVPYNVMCNSNNQVVGVETCLNGLREQLDPFQKKTDIEVSKMYDEFVSNCEEWECFNDEGNVNTQKYLGKYCHMDCVTQYHGWEKFREWVLESLEMDINHYYTISSLADAYLQKKGAYDGCYQLGGVPRAFIQRCVVGGRTMTSENKKHHVKEEVEDLDANSLYPSAMERIGREIGGYLKGKPKVIQTFVPHKYDGYFVCIEVTNDIVGKTMFLDRFSLEDLIKYQGIEYKVINGYYYDEGRNPNVEEIMNHLYDTRVEKKKEENKIELAHEIGVQIDT